MTENPGTPPPAAEDKAKQAPPDAPPVEHADDVAGHVQPPPDFTFENNSR